jgi:hypothetical protein
MTLRPHRQCIQEELRDKYVYDFGCAGDTHECTAIVQRHSTKARGYVGFDHNADAVRELCQHGYDARVYDFDRPAAVTPSPEARRTPAIILLNEVLEHLNNPGDALKQLRQIAVQHDACALLIGVPNRHTLLQNFTYWFTGRDVDAMDHNFGYSIKNLSGLLQKTGWKPQRSWYCYHDNDPTDDRCRTLSGIGRKLEFPLRRWLARLVPRGAPVLMILAEPDKSKP